LGCRYSEHSKILKILIQTIKEQRLLFNSLTFLVFFAITLGIYYLPLSWRLKKWHLLLASYLFYAAWNPPFVLLLWISTGVDWLVAQKIAQASRPKAKKLLLIISLFVNLGLLGYFKYATFVLDSFVLFINQLGVSYHPALPSIILPVGISFYTFQTLSYTIDVYRGAKPCRSLLDFALFVTFFPQLVAGPIVRANYFLSQCTTPKLATSAQLGWGLSLLVIGLFTKIVLADTLLAPIVDIVYNHVDAVGMAEGWLGTLAFSAQIFFDFSGYSTCAIGVALCFGFALPDNFHAPYAAVGFSDFWRRWHISLSTWLRDYLYISMGGNRHGARITYRNLMLTMLLGGLWHGAAWGFIVWGGLHGMFLVSERLLQPVFATFPGVKSTVVQLSIAGFTYLLVCIAWVFFRATDIHSALNLLTTMFFGRDSHDLLLSSTQQLIVVIIVSNMLIYQWLMRNSALEHLAARTPPTVRAVFLAILMICLLFTPGDQRAFIYFQF
jgi:alginate O-acetyltransferase complex protein AlgI